MLLALQGQMDIPAGLDRETYAPTVVDLSGTPVPEPGTYEFIFRAGSLEERAELYAQLAGSEVA